MGGIYLHNNISAFNADKYDNNIKRTLPYAQDFYEQIVEITQTYFQKNP